MVTNSSVLLTLYQASRLLQLLSHDINYYRMLPFFIDGIHQEVQKQIIEVRALNTPRQPFDCLWHLRQAQSLRQLGAYLHSAQRHRRCRKVSQRTEGRMAAFAGKPQRSPVDHPAGRQMGWARYARQVGEQMRRQW